MTEVRYFGKQKASLESLAHYGIKGMRWGVRRSENKGEPKKLSARETARRVKQIERKLNRMDADEALAGLGLIGYEAKRYGNKMRKKHGEDWTGSKLNRKERLEFERKMGGRAIRRQLRRGAVEVGIVLGGAAIAKNTLNLSPRTLDGVRQVSVYMGGAYGIMRLREVKGVNTWLKMQKLKDERNDLLYPPKTPSKK